ncbi:MAG: cytidylate kinase-like family protein, partial [Bacteroidaceae bacterium]|nr:cytidylate kinase-like family protein [Bacteroidaceae bacterium]
WGHSASYDLCVNSSKLGVDETVQLIKAFIKQLVG